MLEGYEKLQLLTQNNDLRRTGIYGWTLPAHYTKLSTGEIFHTCPMAGICAGFCYAKNGTYMFPVVKKNHLMKLELVLNHRQEWKQMMIDELSKKKYQNKYIRIHDSGDYFDAEYAKDWFDIMNAVPDVNFYSYTKMVQMFKYDLADLKPSNFVLIYSMGGKQDNLIDKEKDRHSDVFPDYDDMIAQGYIDISSDDKLAAFQPNNKIGLYRNNIKHYVKRMGNKKFSEFGK